MPHLTLEGFSGGAICANVRYANHGCIDNIKRKFFLQSVSFQICFKGYLAFRLAVFVFIFIQVIIPLLASETEIGVAFSLKLKQYQKEWSNGPFALFCVFTFVLPWI